MNIKKCDRCGKVYDPNDLKLIKINKKSVGRIDLEIKNSQGVTIPFSYYIDLCPTCMNEFREWFAEGENENTI